MAAMKGVWEDHASFEQLVAGILPDFTPSLSNHCTMAVKFRD